jgi:hypothetical protein
MNAAWRVRFTEVSLDDFYLSRKDLIMNAVVAESFTESANAARYARVLTASKKAEWQIDRDLIRGRSFDFSRKFLPDGLSRVDRLGFLSPEEARLLSQIQGRTYAYVFGLVERFISAKMLEQSRARIFGDQLALEGLVRFSNEEIKHQELFRRMEAMMADLIALVAAVDAVLQAQSASDAAYFCSNVSRLPGSEDVGPIEASILAAYRWQYIISGVQHPHFRRLLASMTTAEQMSRIMAALAPLMTADRGEA